MKTDKTKWELKVTIKNDVVFPSGWPILDRCDIYTARNLQSTSNGEVIVDIYNENDALVVMNVDINTFNIIKSMNTKYVWDIFTTGECPVASITAYYCIPTFQFNTNPSDCIQQRIIIDGGNILNISTWFGIITKIVVHDDTKNYAPTTMYTPGPMSYYFPQYYTKSPFDYAQMIEGLPPTVRKDVKRKVDELAKQMRSDVSDDLYKEVNDKDKPVMLHFKDDDE